VLKKKVLTQMVNNSTNINKINNYLEPQIIEKRRKETMTYNILMEVLA
jgi:hypothetical protein